MADGSWYTQIKAGDEMRLQPNIKLATDGGNQPGAAGAQELPGAKLALEALASCQPGAAKACDPSPYKFRDALKAAEGDDDPYAHMAKLQASKTSITDEMDKLIRNKLIAAGGPIWQNMYSQAENLTDQQRNMVAMRYQYALTHDKYSTGHENHITGGHIERTLTEAGKLQKMLDGYLKQDDSPQQTAIDGALMQQKWGHIDPGTVLAEGLVNRAAQRISRLSDFTSEPDRREMRQLIRAAYSMAPLEWALSRQSAANFGRTGMMEMLNSMADEVADPATKAIRDRSRWLLPGH